MAEDKLTEEIHAMFANTKMEAAKTYLEQGRRFETMSADDLKRGWIAQLAAMADATPERDHQLMDDLEAELGFRGIETPADEVPEIVERLVARSKSQSDGWTPQQRLEIDARIEREMSKIRPSISDKN